MNIRTLLFLALLTVSASFAFAEPEQSFNDINPQKESATQAGVADADCPLCGKNMFGGGLETAKCEPALTDLDKRPACGTRGAANSAHGKQ